MSGHQGEPTVDPKVVPVRNAWHLLLYAWDLAHWKGRWDAASEAAPDLLGLLARVLVDCTTQLLQRQLARSHQVAVREIPGVRGRIDFATSLKRMSFDAGRAVCSFPELTIDTLRNRLILATLSRLMTDDRLNVGSLPKQVEALRRDLRAVVERMEGVSLQRIQPSDFGRVHLGRNDEAYRLPLTICALINKCEMPTEKGGHGLMMALARDEITFSDLFERFVRNFLRMHLQDASVTKERLSWHDEAKSLFVPVMETDITVEWPGPGGHRMVMDAKYYAKTLSSRFERADKFHSAHLYQLYAYLRTQEHRGDSFRHASGVLLYPTTSISVDERMRVQGHDIRIVTIDLTQPWQALEASLLEIVSHPVVSSSNAGALSA